ncbi:MAG: stage II sporulation protein M [Armatimonadetes bacterium]|nr:stage II sporulation protein M [Armatimonadota bacterium]
MNEETMLKQRGPAWRRLQDLTGKAGHSFKRLTDEELEEFVRLYRQTSADLAYLTTHSSNESVVQYLNAVVGRAYSQLYREQYVPWGRRIADGMLAAAETVRRRRWYLFVAVVLFFAAAFVSAGLLSYSDDFRAFYIPPGMEENFEAWKSGEFEQRTGGESVLYTGFYASNNPGVAIVANAVSTVSFGLMTVVMMWSNGAMIGALAFEMAGVGKLGHLIVSIAPHGVTELGGIFMAAAGGFVLAAALIRPGRRSRGEALRIAGKDAFVLVVLSIVMTLLAAPIEGFLSFDPRIPDWVKAGVGVLTLAAWTAFFVGYGRNPEPRSVEGSEEPAR